jgi:hypothetical protein
MSYEHTRSDDNKLCLKYFHGVHPKYDSAISYFNRLILDELTSLNINAWVAGGAVRDYFLYNNITSDIDLYFANQESFDGVKEWMLNNIIPFKQVPSSNYYKIHKETGVIIYDTKNSLKIRYKNIEFDLVKIFRNDEIQTINSFDMTVCGAAVSSKGVFMVPDFLLDLASKKIHFQNLHSPFSTLLRLEKYIKKGFSCSYSELHKLAFEIKNIPITEINPVEFQLDQIESTYGRPKRVVNNDRLSNDTNGSSNPVNEIVLPSAPLYYMNDPFFDDNHIISPPDAGKSLLEEIANVFKPSKKTKEEYGDGY